MPVKRILVFGTFDGIHSGHEFFLRSAKARGTQLIVGVARDRHVAELKGKRPNFSESKRLHMIQQLGYVDEAHLCDETLGTFVILKQSVPDLIVLGHDQEALEKALIGWMANTDHYIPVVRIKKV